MTDFPDDAYRPAMPVDQYALREHLGGLKVPELRALADGMAFRGSARREELVSWLLRYNPDAVRRDRDGA